MSEQETSLLSNVERSLAACAARTIAREIARRGWNGGVPPAPEDVAHDAIVEYLKKEDETASWLAELVRPGKTSSDIEKAIVYAICPLVWKIVGNEAREHRNKLPHSVHDEEAITLNSPFATYDAEYLGLSDHAHEFMSWCLANDELAYEIALLYRDASGKPKTAQSTGNEFDIRIDQGELEALAKRLGKRRTEIDNAHQRLRTLFKDWSKTHANPLNESTCV